MKIFRIILLRIFLLVNLGFRIPDFELQLTTIPAVPTEERSYDDENFRFTIPGGSFMISGRKKKL